MVKQNMGGTDRVLRVIGGVALVLVGMFALDGWNGNVLGMVVSLVAFVPIVTGAVGVCPAYLPFRFSTRRDAKTPEA